MPFVPTEKQVNSLYILLQQLIRENIEIRLIRFSNLGDRKDIKSSEIEVLCLEDEDRYQILYNGTIIPKYRYK